MDNKKQRNKTGSPELPSANMEDAKGEGLVSITPEAEIDNKKAEESGKDQPLPEDVTEVNAMPDKEVEDIAKEAADTVTDTEPVTQS